MAITWPVAPFTLDPTTSNTACFQIAQALGGPIVPLAVRQFV
jgi:hypothetical protein